MPGNNGWHYYDFSQLLSLSQCLDFAVTVFVVHLVVCLCYAGFPHSWAWWLTNLVSVAIMAVLGEYLCMRSELAAIPVSGSASLGSKA